ncbi:hypothetical protein [Brevibacillus laterosporus]|uniref:Uncharacterized protein n=1 Tax=Brevibacillus laterosporus TaxID=1465 RepID=A0AAP3DM90_BRELA|nr:hypothetical protein [Brevibacillus laterosporus]MCR8983246.1 hypothetical protein [Brevibacillus laterosporus]MCZ0810402.1 hypothetical protein [Brevibacillus laterosporus]MCZ0853116.1 hypothetical protein [Brevibacillus laterosporus]
MNSKQIIPTNKFTQQEVEWVKLVIQSQDDPKAKEILRKIKKPFPTY